MTAPGGFSWDAVAAELAAAQRAAGDPAQRERWDDVAAQLADVLAARPGPDGELLDLLADDDDDEDADAVEERPVPEQPPELFPTGPADPAVLRGGLEALLFVVDSPVDEETLAAALDCSLSEVRAGLAGLAAEHAQRGGGFELRRVGAGWRLYTREEHAAVVERYLLGGQRNRLTQAALETLAVIAYRQPVTRARVSGIRGVGVDGVMRTLISRGLIREDGTDPDTGGGRYVTTPLFLERLGLTGLDELPDLGPLLPEPSSLLDERPG